MFSTQGKGLSWLLLIILYEVDSLSSSTVPVFQICAKPNEVMYCDIGQDLSLRWSFTETSRRMILNHNKDQSDREFLFGEWSSPGYISNKILLVRGSAVMTRNSYMKKITYNGSLSNECSNCTAEIKLFNLTHADVKTYGVSIFIYPYVHPLQSQLRVALRVPPKIIVWLKDIKVFEGNTTSIICRAEGKPSPVVKILDHNNKTITSGIGEAVNVILDVKLIHAGNYFCVIYPEDKRQPVIRDEMRLEVAPSGKMKAKREMETTVAASTVSSSEKRTKVLYSIIIACLIVSQYVKIGQYI